jgi:phosphate/sulfate permease
VQWPTVLRLLIVWGTTLPLALALGIVVVNVMRLLHLGY